MKRRKLAPSKQEFHDVIRLVEVTAKRAEDAYKWVHELAYGQTRRRGYEAPTSGGGDPEAPAHADTTGEIAVGEDKEGARQRLVKARNYAATAVEHLDKAEAVLRRGFGRPGLPEFGPFPVGSRALKADVEAAEAAQERRRQRQEGWGNG